MSAEEAATVRKVVRDLGYTGPFIATDNAPAEPAITKGATVTIETEVKPVAVGDLFEASWGYDQTNIDYYKVVRCTDKTAWLVKIGEKVVEGSEGFMCERVLPNPDVVICDRCNGGEDYYLHGDPAESHQANTERFHEYQVTPTRHRINYYGGFRDVALKVYSFAYAYRITGTESSYQSHYA